MRRPSYFQRLLPKLASAPVLKPPRQLLRPLARGFETLDIEQPSPGTAAVASRSVAASAGRRATPSSLKPQADSRPDQFEASAAQRPVPGDGRRQAQPRPDSFESTAASVSTSRRTAGPQSPSTMRGREADPSAPQTRPPRVLARATGAAASGPGVPDLHPRLEALNRAAERFAGKTYSSGNTAASSSEPPPARAVAVEQKGGNATSLALQPPQVAPASSGVAATSPAPPKTSAAFVQHTVPAESLWPRLPSRDRAAPAVPQRPSVTIGTLEVRITPPAQSAPPRPATKAPRRVAPTETRALSRPIAAFGFGQT